MAIDTWIVLTASMVAVACVLPGCFLFLSRQSMMTHGIAHSVLPGIVVGHLVTGQVETPALFIGAIIAGVLCAVLSRALQNVSGLEEGAALGISFTFLFAVGLVLQRLFADSVHIEPSHVLMGNLEVASMVHNGVPEVFGRASVVVALNLLFVVLFFKELVFSSFDPNHAATVGARPRLVYYGTMIFSALTCVVAFEAVGSILVVAMMILPPAIASFFTKDLKRLIVLAVLCAVVACFLGHLLSISVFGSLSAHLFQLSEIGSTNTAGGITVVLGVLLTIAIIQAKWLNRQKNVRHIPSDGK